MNEDIGIEPAGHRVLVKPDDTQEDKDSVIKIPDSVKDRYQMAQTTGYIVGIGKTAWKTEDFGNEKWAEIGDRVCFAKYGGLIMKGKDGSQYRLLNDEDITAIIDEDVQVGEDK